MVSASLGIDIEAARRKCIKAVENGSAINKMKEGVSAQGGNPDFIDDESLFTLAPYKRELLAERDGYISAVRADAVGEASMLLGAGRRTKEDTIDLGAGIELKAKIGHFVKKNQPIAVLYASHESLFDSAVKKLKEAFIYSANPTEKSPLIYKTIK